MKIKKILLALCTVLAALCCAGCSTGNVQAPKLSEENLDGWTLCFRGAWLRDKSSFLEYDLKEIVENEGKVEIEYAYTGRILQLDVVACYRGVAQKDIIFLPGPSSENCRTILAGSGVAPTMATRNTPE